jgi:DNA-binding PadR family transcriptional regulator
MYREERIQQNILLILDRQPCHGYELRRRLQPVAGDLEITTLYRWLHTMEHEGLIDSRQEKGPNGPLRRVYRLGDRGEKALREILRDSLAVVLHFYSAYRDYALSREGETEDLPRGLPPPGPTLVGIASLLAGNEREFLNTHLRRAAEQPLCLLGECWKWEQAASGLPRLDGEPWDVACGGNMFGEFWILGVPPREKLPRTVMEALRILRPGGIFRMDVPFVFSGEPNTQNLDAFIRVTASHLFPELGVFEGYEIQSVFEPHFQRTGVIEISPGYMQFWGIKQ